jgi:trans-aconitate 2-methyltransferase
LRPGGWLVAQCGGGPNLKRLRDRADELMESPKFATSFAGFREPWEYSDAETAAVRLRKAGFASVETNLEQAPTTMDSADHFSDFVRSVIMRVHLERLSRPLQDEFLAALTERAAKDDPPFSLDYWRLNLSARVPA